MKTFAEIYEIALKAGIVDEYKRYNLLLAEAISSGKDTNSLNYNFDQQQIKILVSLQYEITGIRPGSCNGCVSDVIKNMNNWLKKNEPIKQNKNEKHNRNRINRK